MSTVIDLSATPEQNVEPTNVDQGTSEATFSQAVNLDDESPLLVYDQNGNEYTANVTDGDTVILTDNAGNTTSVRLSGGDTGERVKFVGDAFDPGSASANLTKDYVEDQIRSGRFNTVTLSDEKTYGRTVGDLVDAGGRTISTEMVAERLIDPDRFTTREQMFARGNEQLRDLWNLYDYNTTDADKARDVYNAILSTSPSYTKQLAGSKEEYDNYEFWRGHQGISAMDKLIKDIDAKLEDTSITEEERNALTAQRGELESTLQSLLLDPPKYYGYIGQAGRANTGVFGELESSFVGGLYMLEGNAANFLYWAGDALGAESLENYGKAWAQDNSRDVSQHLQGLTGLWDIRGGGDALQFTGNTILQYGPQIGVILAGGKGGALVGSAFGPVGTAVGGAIGSLGTAFILAVSNIYEEMPEGEKNPYVAAGLAVPVMLLDRYGADKFGPLASKLVGKNVLTKDGLDETADIMSQALGITKEEAIKRINRDVLEATAQAGTDLSALAKEGLVARQGLKDLLWTGSKSVGREAITEALQEGIQGAGVAATTSIVLDYKELGKRMIEGGIIGGVAGVPFGVFEGSAQNAAVNTVIYENTPGAAPSDREFEKQEALLAHLGEQKTTEEIIRQSNLEYVEGQTKADGSDTLLEDIEDADAATYKRAFLDSLKAPWRLLGSFRKNATEEQLTGPGEPDPEILELQAFLGDLRGGIIGTTLPATVRRYTADYLSSLSSIQVLAQKAGVDSPAALDALRTRDYNTLTPKEKQVLDQMRNEENNLMEKVIADIEARGLDITEEQKAVYRDNFLEKVNAVNNDLVDDKFIDLVANLQNPFAPKSNQEFLGKKPTANKLGREFAEEFAKSLRENPTGVNTVNTAEAIGLYTDPQFSDYRNDYDIRTNAILMANRFANRNAKTGVEKYIVQKIIKSKLTPANKAKLAAKMNQYLKMVDGDFNNIETAVISNVQEAALLMSQFAYMDTNFFANTADLVYGMMRIDNKSDMMKYFGNFAKAFSKGLYSDLTIVREKAGGKARTQKWELEHEGLESLRLTGHLAEQSETAQIEGTNITKNKGFQNLSALLFKMNLVENYTDSTKAAISAPFWNDFTKLVGVVAEAKNRGGQMSPGEHQALRRLRIYNADIDWWVKMYNQSAIDDVQAQALQSMADPESPLFREVVRQYQTVAINYTDEFTARPEPGSAWKISEDEHLRLVTQYKRFISHFTANIIPNLWKNYIKHGSPQVRFQMFRNIMLTFVMAFTAQALKDLMKYGGEAPYLEEWDENFWNSSYGRGIRYTGWVGTPEIIFESILKYRDDYWKSHPQRMLELLLGQSAIANTAYQIGTSRDPLRTIKGKTPFLGDIEATREHLLGL